jgi:hypothetical protein
MRLSDSQKDIAESSGVNDSSPITCKGSDALILPTLCGRTKSEERKRKNF